MRTGANRKSGRIVWQIDDIGMFEIMDDWRTAASEPRRCHGTVREGESRFMLAWRKEEERAAEYYGRKRRTGL